MYKCNRILIVFLSILLSASFLYADEPETADEQSHICLVKEAKVAGNYTYLKLEEDGKDYWIASMPKYLKITVTEGDKVEYLGGIMMKDFESKAMGKTFEWIRFVSRIRVLKKDADTIMPKDDVHKQIGDTNIEKSPFKAPKDGEIKKAIGGKTISEIFLGKDSLKDKEVILNAKVIKISKNVLKKNWITVSDGTGTAPDNKIVILTLDTAEINDIMTVKGIIKTDVNLGAGYKYNVLLDEAKIIKQ